MANINSDQYAIASAPPISTPLDPNDMLGRVRVAYFKFTNVTVAAADVLFHCRMPAGKVRLLRWNINRRPSLGAGGTQNLGHNGYTPLTGAAVAASAAAFSAAIAMDVATYYTDAVLGLGANTIHSKTGFDVTGTLAVAGGAGKTWEGWIEFVVD